jgi:diguanylate cyclase (GGDEF)-like protein
MVSVNGRYTFGLIIDQISSWSEYENSIIAGVSDFTRANDINLACFVAGKLVSPYEWERSRNIMLEFVTPHHIDGLIIIPTSIGSYANHSITDAMLSKFKDIPLVTISEAFHPYHSVSIDNYSGMKQAVEHLIKVHSCKRLAFILGPPGSKECADRYQAYLDALEENQLAFDPELVYPGNYFHESGTEAVQHLIKNRISFDAIVASNDNMALGVMNELRNPLTQIPNHIPIVGFDDSEFAGHLGLTTIRQSFYDEAALAASMLLRILSGEHIPKSMELPTELILRSSCGCMPKIVSNTIIPLQEYADHHNKPTLETVKMTILEELQQIHPIDQYETLERHTSLVSAYQHALVDALFIELMEHEEHRFFQDWNSYIYWAVTNQQTSASLHDILTSLRKHMLHYLTDVKRIAAAENLFQAARVQVSDAIAQMTAAYYFDSSMHAATLDTFSEELFVVLGVEEQMKIASEVLPDQGIHFCFIALYDDPNKPLETASVIMAYIEDEKLELGEASKNYRTSDLLPAHMLKRLQQMRHNCIIQALHHGDSKLGYVVFGFEHNIKRSFETIRHRLSIALKSALLMEDTIRHTSELEQQVSERTKELSATNQQLLSEIQKREDAQDQLNKALQDLAVLNEDLRALSIRDELTGLLNRRGFMAASEQILNRAKQDETAFIVMFADLDKLKHINDSYGHEEGDRAIQGIAEILSDMLPTSSTLSRLAGDEFTAIIPIQSDTLSEQDLRRFIQTRLAVYNSISNKPYRLSLSMGFSTFDPVKELTFSDLMKQADDMLYEEKANKRQLLLHDEILDIDK